MALTKKEKKLLFWALLDYYPKYERERRQIKKYSRLFAPPNKEEMLKNIDVEEEKAYNLLVKLSKEVDVKLPPYVKPKE